MNCPNCAHELPESAERCPACNVELAGSDDVETSEAPQALVTVLETTDATLIPVVRSLLEAEGIACTPANEVSQDMLGWGRLGVGYNPLLGPAFLQVALADEEAARALIAHHFAAVDDEPAN